MPKKNLPAWQQVVLTALNNVPKAADGHDAWQKLNAEEQAAVMGFLGEHCGHDPEKAQAMLEETAGMVKARKRGAWIWVLILLLIITATAVWVYWELEKHLGDLSDYIMMLLCLSRLEQAWNVTPTLRMVRVWTERTENRSGTASALKEMERLLSLPKKELRSKAALISWSVLLVVVMILAFAIP